MARRVTKNVEKPAMTASAGQESAPEPMVTHEDIAARAYRIYDESGRVEGQDLENWLRAEAELRAGQPAAPASFAKTATVPKV